MTEAPLAHRSVLLVHPTGGPAVHQALAALGEAGAHTDFYTTIAWRPGSVLDRVLPQELREQLARRSYLEVAPEQIHTHNFREMVRILAQRKGWESLIRHESGPFRLDAVCATLDQSTARSVSRLAANGRAPDAVYAYDDCALETFRGARAQGAACIYDLPIGHTRKWRELRDREVELEPLWGQTIAGKAFSDERLARKDREIGAADRVIVPSRFVAETLADSAARNVVIVPYGCPAVASLEPADGRQTGPLRILWVGFISQRKGIGYLLKAMEQLKGMAELTLVGQFAGDSPELLAQLNRHRWIRTMPHAQVLNEMRNHDVFVLPTLWEGRALVVLEALSQGLPVITTPNAGTEDVVLDGISGLIVPIRSAEAIAQGISSLRDDRGLLQTMREQALRLAAQTTWNRYRAVLTAAIAEMLPAR